MSYAKQIRDYVVTNFLFSDSSALQDDTSFLDNGLIDSTGILELVMFIENTFHIKVLPEETLPENFDSVNRVAQFVERKLAPKT